MGEVNEIVDYTCTEREGDEEQMGVRLKSGISLPRAGGSFLMEPVFEPDCFEISERELKETYFRSENSSDRLVTGLQDEFDIMDDWERLKLKMTPLTEDGGVLKFCKFAGQVSSEKVSYKSAITCFYELLIEGQDEPFDSSFIRGLPERFKMDSNQILPGIEILIKTMKVGETAVGILDSVYAFGELGVPPRIPGNCDIMVTVKLLRVTPQGELEKLLGMPESVRLEMSIDAIMNAAEKENGNGNQFFKSKEWKLAIQQYNLALRVLQERSVEEQSKETCKGLIVKLHLNKAMCYINLRMGKKAVQECKKALGLQQRNVKAHYRLGKAYALLKDYEKAKEELSAAAALQPTDRDINRELVNLDQVIRQQNKQEFNYCQNMFKDYEKSTGMTEEEVMRSPYYSILKEFKESDSVELVLPGSIHCKERGKMRKVADYLNLTLEHRNVLGSSSSQQIRIKKMNT